MIIDEDIKPDVDGTLPNVNESEWFTSKDAIVDSESVANDDVADENNNIIVSLNFLKEIEEELIGPEGLNDRSAYLFGSKKIMGWHRHFFRDTFEDLGFNVSTRSKRGRLPTEKLFTLHHSAVLCLAYAAEECFFDMNAHRVLKPYQKLNRLFFYRLTLWDKGEFCKTLRKGTQHDPIFGDYTFHCWVLPEHKDNLREYMEQNRDQVLIAKPYSRGGGNGIFLVHGAKQAGKKLLKKSQELVVQTYLPNPMLINSRKWDIRVFCLVGSDVPLRAYMYSRGVLRFAASKYNKKRTSDSQSQFLTNLHVGERYVKEKTELTWTFDQLKEELERQGKSFETLLNGMLSTISIVLLSGEKVWREQYNSLSDNCPNCYRLLGIDIIVDDELKPRVIETNGQPSILPTKDLKSEYSQTKLKMMHDYIKMIHKRRKVSEKLFKALEKFESKMLFKKLNRLDWIYLVDYLSERLEKGLWLNVYPNNDIEPVHRRFFSLQNDTPPNRLALHEILNFLETTNLS